MKVCTKCKVEKLEIEFSKNKSRKDGHNVWCKYCYNEYNKNNKNKKCKKEYQKKYQLDNKDRLKQNRIKNKEIQKEYKKQYYIENKEEISIYNKQYNIDNKEYKKQQDKQYRLDNKEKIKEQQKQWYLDNPEHRKKYYVDNKEKANIRQKNRKLIDPLYKLRCNISTLIYMSVTKQGYSKKSKTYEILGCSFEEFKTHLENKFTEGMTWENHGEWELDHIFPVSRAIDEEHLIILNHYTNFQPLWKEDNRKKSNKIIGKAENLKE